MRGIAIVLVLVGCGDAPDSDIDGDGLRDADDDCQASFADEIIDVDGDGKDATDDLCPHDPNAISGDLDGDGIPDACDPFIDEARRDTRRCVTSFGVRWMNASYLKPRAGEQPFDLAPPISTTSNMIAHVISSLPLAYPTVAFDVVGEAGFADANASFRVYLRTGENRDLDVACGVDGTNRLFILANGEQHASRPTPPLLGTTFPFRLRAVVGGSNANVLCRLTVGGETITTVFETELPTGGWGFASELADLRIDSLVIDTNDAPVAYRNRSD